MNEISTRFKEISPNFGDEICYDISRKWMNEISTKFSEILRNFGNEIFDEISRKKMNQKLNLLSYLFRISRNKKNRLSQPP
jgi:hypothetical protein